jgi:hypothetical protein
LGLSPSYDRITAVDDLKIAILDYGFDGVNGQRSYLPKDTVVVENYDPEFVRRFQLGDPDFKNPMVPGNRHGRAMAQIIWAVTGFRPNGPHFLLLNANGPTMLHRAVRYAIESKVDIILFSDVFEGGGNGDGRGPINRMVSEAIDAGIIWINAAGNYGKCVYNGPVRVDSDGWLRFRSGYDGDCLRFRNRLDENPVTITLTWNDYRDQEDAGTTKDLDLYVEDWNGKRVGASTNVQISAGREAGAGESKNPRERVILSDLPASGDYNYRIRIKAKSNNFSPRDILRVLVTAAQGTYVNPATGQLDDAVSFWDASGKGELYPPADHPLVFTVGDGSEVSSKGPTMNDREKPDVVIDDSRAYFTDGEMSAGSSNAAAYFTGVVAVLKAAEPRLRAEHLFHLAKVSRAPPVDQESRPSRQPQRRPIARAASRFLRNYMDPSQPPIEIMIPYAGRLIISGSGPRPPGIPPGQYPLMPRPGPANPQLQSSREPDTPQPRGSFWHTPSPERLHALVADQRKI